MTTKYLLTLTLALAARCACCFPYYPPRPVEDDCKLWDVEFRQTPRGGQIPVGRMDVSPKLLADLKAQEAEYARVYPESRLVISGECFPWSRNCHDFAWGTYDDMLATFYPEYPEAWRMGDPSANWTDGSFQPLATAFELFWDGNRWVTLDGAPAGAQSEYCWDPSVLGPLPAESQCQDTLGFPLYLPVLITDDSRSDYFRFVHSALMGWSTQSPNFSYVAGTREYTCVNETYQACYCYYVSKWGDCGIYRHRIGTAYCPPAYLYPPELFVPTLLWGGSPPYGLYPPSPWGFPPLEMFNPGPPPPPP